MSGAENDDDLDEDAILDHGSVPHFNGVNQRNKPQGGIDASKKLRFQKCFW